MRTLSKKSRVAIVGAVVVAVAGGGVAYGYWSTSGSAAGTAESSPGGASLTIEQTAAPSDLAPGAPAGVISGTVHNTAAHSAYVHQVSVSITGVTQAPYVTGTCTASDYTLSNPTMTLDKELAADGSAAFSGATLAFNDTDSNQDGCKGATVHLTYTAS
jgi:hypothetical protein